MMAHLACRNMRWASPLRLTSLRTRPLARNALHTGHDSASAHSQLFQHADCQTSSHVWLHSLDHGSRHLGPHEAGTGRLGATCWRHASTHLPFNMAA